MPAGTLKYLNMIAPNVNARAYQNAWRTVYDSSPDWLDSW
jgi:hypothetical protein